VDSGMGIIVLFVAILPKLSTAGKLLFRAEAPGPTEDKIKPRIRDTAKILWMVYVVISALQIAALHLAGMSTYDAVTHTFTTMATGGFSPYGQGIAAFDSPLIEAIITIFMFIAERTLHCFTGLFILIIKFSLRMKNSSSTQL
jgi:trk system potassium uptake protein TrkH